jgi:hypothetical protein
MYSHILFRKKQTLQGNLTYSYQKYLNNATFYNATSCVQTFLVSIFSMCTIIENSVLVPLLSHLFVLMPFGWLCTLWQSLFICHLVPKWFVGIYGIVLGSFAKLWRPTISFIMSVLLSVHTKLGSHWTDFHEIWYLGFFQNLLRKFKFIKIR